MLYYSALLPLLTNLVHLATETRIQAVRSPCLAPELCVEERIHLHQQAAPASLLLQPQCVGRSLSIKPTRLHKEQASLKEKCK